MFTLCLFNKGTIFEQYVKANLLSGSWNVKLQGSLKDVIWSIHTDKIRPTIPPYLSIYLSTIAVNTYTDKASLLYPKGLYRG